MSVLRQVWAAWKRIGQAIGDVIARVVLTVFYFTIAAPFGIGVRLFGDPLDVRTQAAAGNSNWSERPVQEDSLQKARRLS